MRLTEALYWWYFTAANGDPFIASILSPIPPDYEKNEFDFLLRAHTYAHEEDGRIVMPSAFASEDLRNG